MDLMDLDPDLRAVAEGELAPDEKVHWAGQPQVGRAMLGAIPIVLFGIPFAGFAIFWMWPASSMGHGISMGGPFDLIHTIFPLFGLPFILVGLGMLASPWWMGRKARRTVYLITDRRAVILAGTWNGHEVRSFAPDALAGITKRVRGDGSGDLVFTTRINVTTDSDGDRRTSRTEIGFIHLAEVQDTERLLRRTLLPSV